mgnify:FL=1
MVCQDGLTGWSNRKGETHMAKQTAPDVLVHDDGSVVAFTLQSTAAQDWISENTHTESWQWLGRHTLVVDARFAEGLAEGMCEAGLTLN